MLALENPASGRCVSDRSHLIADAPVQRSVSGVRREWWWCRSDLAAARDHVCQVIASHRATGYGPFDAGGIAEHNIENA